MDWNSGSLDIQDNWNYGWINILDKLSFMCRLEEDEIVLDDVVWFFIQPNWIKAGVEAEELDNYRNEKISKLRKNDDFRFDLIIQALEKCKLVEDSPIEYNIALLLGVSEEQFLSWQVKNQSQFIPNNSITEVGHNSNPIVKERIYLPTEFSTFQDAEDKPYEYPTMFDMNSVQDIVIHLAASATENMTAAALVSSLEPHLEMLESQKRTEISRLVSDRIKDIEKTQKNFLCILTYFPL